jgi:hypothetical protein
MYNASKKLSFCCVIDLMYFMQATRKKGQSRHPLLAVKVNRVDIRSGDRYQKRLKRGK